MNPFAAIPNISGGAGGIDAGSSASNKQEVGGAGGIGFGPVTTGSIGASVSSTNTLIYAGAALLAVYLLRGRL